MKLAWWDRDENDGRSFPPWRPFDHPQLGAGRDRRHRSARRHLEPAAARARRRCARRRRSVFLRVAALAPRLRIAASSATPLARRAHARRGRRSSNDGYLGSYGAADRRRSSTSTSRSTRPRRPRAASSSIRARRTRCSATSTAGATACTPARTCPRIRARAAPRTRRGRPTSCAAAARSTLRIGSCRAGFVDDAHRGLSRRAPRREARGTTWRATRSATSRAAWRASSGCSR